jgi:hypothetical protein
MKLNEEAKNIYIALRRQKDEKGRRKSTLVAPTKRENKLLGLGLNATSADESNADWGG